MKLKLLINENKDYNIIIFFMYEMSNGITTRKNL